MATSSASAAVSSASATPLSASATLPSASAVASARVVLSRVKTSRASCVLRSVGRTDGQT
jgi:hypothetical protein